MVKENRVPVHVSMIMDGNGRWAKQRGQERVYGHLNGVESIRAVTEESVAQGVKYLSLYAFSEENWGRPEGEVSYLMDLMVKSISAEFETFMKNGVRFMVLGNRAQLSPMMNEAIDLAMAQTAGNTALTFILFISYSGKWDILQAAKKLAREAAEDPEKLAKLDGMAISDFDPYLVTAGIPDPDLIIRTSGEQRLSNYLLWQGAYSEFYFTDVLWPDFRKEEYRAALETYASRDRRYGKVK